MPIFVEEARKGDFTDFGYDYDDEIDESSSDCCSSPSSSYSSSPWHFYPSMLSERDSFSYRKFQLEPLRLVVLKLDGSSFEIFVPDDATVADLKQAVENEFSHLSEEAGMISWSHVWGQFCLCFHGYKLVNDHDSIELYGIEDGDQLQFIRRQLTEELHSVSYDNSPQNIRNKKELGGHEEDTKFHSSWFQIMKWCF